MSRTKKPASNLAPNLSEARCPLSDADLARLLKQPKTFRPDSCFATELRPILAFASLVRHESRAAPTRSQLGVALAEIERKAKKLHIALIDLDQYSSDAFDLPRARYESPGPYLEIVDHREAITWVGAVVRTSGLAREAIAKSTSKRDRLEDRYFIGRSLFNVHWRHSAQLREASVRKFIAKIHKLLGLTCPNPAESASAFDRVIFGELDGSSWLRWARQQMKAKALEI